jgi:ribosome-binding protein aMBF1 (putative translation factor)
VDPEDQPTFHLDLAFRDPAHALLSNEVDPPPHEALMHHGIPVKAAREAAGMDIADLHVSTGIDVDRVEAFECGGATPSSDEATRISAATDVPSDIFVE